MGWCPHCKENHPTHRDYDTGTMISCSNCGKVLQHDEFTDEPTFVKGAGGESRLAGSYVKSFQSDYSESFRRTIDKGKQKIHELAVSLGIEDGGAINLADAFYKIAVERSFTKGRRTDQVAAACLYIACRYVLGAVFLQLCQLLSLQEHPIVQKAVDPSLFISRYTNALVGENRKVNSTALHIIASMKRDWMQTGRKPSGLCGAAVYISALSHGFKCSKLDIVKAVHVCEATLTKRLIEFENTDSGSLTIEELIRNADELKKEDRLSKLSDANSRNSETMEVLCQHKDRKPHFAGLCESCCQEFIELSGGIHGGADPPAFQIAERERLAEVSSEKVTDSSFILKPHRHEGSDEHISEVELEHSTKANQNATEAETANFTESACASSVEDQATIGDDADIFQKSNDTNSIADEPDRLSDIDDDEVEGYLNNEEECYYKKIIWEEMNKEYLQEQAAKEAAAAAAFKDLSGASDEMRSAQELAAAANAAVAKSREERRKKRASENGNPAQTAAEATRQMLTKKGLSSKINYDVLDKLFDDQPVHDTKRTRIESPRASDIDVQQQFSKERNGAYTDYDGDEKEEENGEVEDMGGEEPDEWYSRNEEEVEDYSYYDNDGDDEY
ncbi:transcription factor IIIB 60 kDa subunit isoform X2 [Rhododendron vialii]|uniref:transcription factor IIIB 60 kDa subunit isoform X2 n=1 Tax=Rhododendron vialii TaxID=182163 RepID=UPI00265EE32D|nr:transcription factor IIIB 60 kDa subunit isoform X2 [Rhododendron vialii]